MNHVLIQLMIELLIKKVDLLELQLQQITIASSSIPIVWSSPAYAQMINPVGSQGQTATTSIFSQGDADLRAPYLIIPPVDPKGIHYSTEGTKLYYGN